MGLKPGQTNNRAGRPAGRQNKATADLRTFVTNLLTKNQKQLADDFDELSLVQRVQAFIKMLSFVLPQLQSVAMVDELERLSETEIDKIIKQLQNGQAN